MARSRCRLGPYVLHERVRAHVIAGRGDEPTLGRLGDHAAALLRRERKGLLTDDVHSSLECCKRLRRMRVVRRADVERVDLLGLE